LALTGRAASTPTEYALDVVAGQNYNVVLDHTQTGRRVSIEMQVYKKEPIEFSALVAKLTDVDAIVYVGGLSPRLEGEEMPVTAEGFQSGDKISIDLPRVQRQLLADLKSTGKPVVFVLCTGSSLALEQDEKNYDALLCAWYGGEAAGTAVADVLFGDYNPAGRLPVTFYKTLAQLDNALAKTDDPARQGFENYDMTGRTYRYMTEAPLYPFGHGLSYSTFAYGDAKLDAQTISTGNGTHITIPVTNSSNIAGDEVVQVYVKRNNDPAAPVKNLRAFKRVRIEPGKTQEITLQIDPASFEFYDAAADGLVAKPGSYTILYGGTSADAGQKSLNLTVQ
jgi:beta-glucosidase